MASAPHSTELTAEPSLAELMADPIIQLIMQRDGVNLRDMHGEFERVKQIFTEQAVA